MLWKCNAYQQTLSLKLPSNADSVIATILNVLSIYVNDRKFVEKMYIEGAYMSEQIS